MQVHKWQVLELELSSGRSYANPWRDVEVIGRFRGPNGAEKDARAFWDGGDSWKLRFCPDCAGTWTFRVECSEATDSGLHGIEGAFECLPYIGDNPLYRYGPLRVHESGWHFEHADGTPFFWLADTAWNGVLKAKPGDWERYLTTRKAQGFTAVQHVMTEWRALLEDALGQKSHSKTQPLLVNPEFFQRLDAKMAAINQHGLVSAPVILWAIAGDENPGYALAEEDAISLARYIVTRYSAYHVMWILAGDGDYRGEQAEKWRRIGGALFTGNHERLVTMHPGGMHWVADEFAGEEWYDFVSYQSGHGDSDDTLRWLIEGPPAQQWLKLPRKPIVNQEPNYEAHPAYQSGIRFDARKVRRALYWSLLVAPTCGVTYGHHGIWPWMDERGIPVGHPRTGEAPPWWEALGSLGGESVRHLADLFSRLPWWTLRPAQGLLAEQPGEESPDKYVAASRSEDGSLAVIYAPVGGRLSLRVGEMPEGATCTWFDPRTGASIPATSENQGNSLVAPDALDWILLLRA